jgi:AcrR family transcriptional regulator
MSKKENILNGATRLLARKGYKEASMAELANLIGVAHGTIFYHFNKKETLFISVLDRFQTQLAEAFTVYENSNSFSNGLEALLKKVEFFFLTAGKMQDEFLLIHRHDAYEIAGESEDCRNMLEGIYSSIVGFFERAIEIGQKDGSIRLSKARNTAMIILVMVDGLIRFNAYGIYDPGALYEDFLVSIHKIVAV